MRAALVLLLTTFSLITSACSRAEAFESFTLGEHDTIIAENPGCYASCTGHGGKRTCMIKNLDCRAVCRTIPECTIEGRMVRVCAVVKSTP